MRFKPQQGCLCAWYKPGGRRWWRPAYYFWHRCNTDPDCPMHKRR